jgi:hypothetical protein
MSRTLKRGNAMFIPERVAEVVTLGSTVATRVGLNNEVAVGIKGPVRSSQEGLSVPISLEPVEREDGVVLLRVQSAESDPHPPRPLLTQPRAVPISPM